MGIDEETITKAAAERRSKVSIEIEPVDDDQVKLTAVHDDFPAESTVRELISGGWPWKLADGQPMRKTDVPSPSGHDWKPGDPIN